MSKTPPGRGAPAQFLRAEIEAAAAQGVATDAMVLRVTFGDMSKLRRDPTLALTDISFTDGVMRYLGVRVEQGPVTVSGLERTDTPVA